MIARSRCEKWFSFKSCVALPSPVLELQVSGKASIRRQNSAAFRCLTQMVIGNSCNDIYPPGAVPGIAIGVLMSCSSGGTPRMALVFWPTMTTQFPFCFSATSVIIP